MRISKKYLKQLMECYESQEKEIQKTIESYEVEILSNPKPLLEKELGRLYITQAKLQGKMSLCKWLIEL